MKRPEPIACVLELLAQRYRGASATFLAGSVMRGEGTDSSDLDLVIVYDHLDAAYRESFVHEGWPIEAFVHDPETLRYFFLNVDLPSGVPSLIHMVSTGTALPAATKLSQDLQAFAQKLLAQGPIPWDDERHRRSRYMITSLVDDLRCPRSRAELLAAGTALYEALAAHLLLGDGHWFGKGKSIPRQLTTSLSPQVATQFDAAFDRLFATSDSGEVIRLCDEVLATCGDSLFEGYKAMAPPDWRITD